MKGEKRVKYHKGVPDVTVTVDSKQSKGSPQALLPCQIRHWRHFGAGDKNPAASDIAPSIVYTHEGISQEKNTFFKNWNGSSSCMKMDVIMEGFKEAGKGPWLCAQVMLTRGGGQVWDLGKLIIHESKFTASFSTIGCVKQQVWLI